MVEAPAGKARGRIEIRGARTHNLRDIDCSIPIGALTVVTGVSGSGKSTLAFDTLYAEGHRRYVSSLSTYARQFLERLPRPDVDSISSLPPAIAIEQRNRVTAARSTVGTATELLDHLRLLFAELGGPWCDDCDRPADQGTVAAIGARLWGAHRGGRLSLCAPMARRRGETQKALAERLARDGHTRLLTRAGEVVDFVEATPGERRKLLSRKSGSALLIDRVSLRPIEGAEDAGPPRRLLEAIENALAMGEGELIVDVEGAREHAREGLSCGGCGRRFARPEPALLSFNNPLGACPACQGFGRVAELDWSRIVPDPSLSLEAQAIVPFGTSMGRAMQRDLMAACASAGVSTDIPFSELDEEARAFVLEGDEERGGDWYGVRGFFDWLEGRRYKVQARVLIARYRRFATCTACAGTRLCADARAIRLGGLELGALCKRSVAEVTHWVEGLGLDEHQRARATRILEALLARLATVNAVGLDYIGLDRQVRTLSGGEAQRIQLASALGGSLTAALYVLDEPSIGLHARDQDRLLAVLRGIRDQGNTVVVVEHAPEILAAADHVIDLGPDAGRRGGRVVGEGPPDRLREVAASKTGALLRGEYEPSFARRATPRGTGRSIRVVGARENNLAEIDVEFPLGALVAVTGVSGAGKSTLVHGVLVGGLLPPGERPLDEIGDCEEIVGAEHVSRVVVVDQSPAVRSPRSNLATVSKAFEVIRQRFAATREAKALGVSPGWFSFNVAGGRCEGCEGAGEIVIDMQFLDDVRVPCDDCGGLRYRREALEVRLEGRSIVDVLALTVDEACEVFAGQPRLVARLEPFQRVGLGYLQLGQPLATFSGGEHQRVRLAMALAERDPRALYVLDEPTTGLHTADVALLLSCLDELVDSGASVIVVEHNLDVIRRADHIIDVGPEGGPGGGRIVATGTPAQVAAAEDSLTGRALARLFD